MAQEASSKETIEAEIASASARLDAARLLLSKGKLTDAVNRMYYAAFHAARAVLHSLGKDPKTHAGLISEFSLWVVRPELMAAADFSALRRSYEARETSDYTIAVVFEEKEVSTLFQDVSLFVSRAAAVARKQAKIL